MLPNKWIHYCFNYEHNCKAELPCVLKKVDKEKSVCELRALKIVQLSSSESSEELLNFRCYVNHNLDFKNACVHFFGHTV